MIIDLFHPFEDDMTQRFQDDFQPPYSNFDRLDKSNSRSIPPSESTFMLKLWVGISRQRREVS
jgi:hypothetical protein